MVKARLGRRWGALAATIAVLAAGCSGNDGGGSAQPAATDDPGVSHIHGLGIRPGEDMVYAATHFGLFALSADGEATRIADRYQDTMAFTVDGRERFLASGHPDQQDEELRKEGKPPHLGLVESRDEGSTWDPISLLGEADFHALSVVGDAIYGYDATGDQLRVSEDGGNTWDTRSTGIGMRGVAADPAGGGTVVGVMPAGLELSSDGGRSFSALPGSPAAALVSWPSPGELWAVEGSGAVHRSAGPGGPWTAVGSAPGNPEAFVATSGLLAVAVTGPDDRTAVLVSRDGAATWTLRYREPGPS